VPEGEEESLIARRGPEQTAYVNPEELLTLLGWIPQEDWRREHISRVVDALSSSREEAEVRKWFRRPQPGLGRRTPLEALRLAKRHDDPLLEELWRLAGEPNS
jgi:uncharacterized protein (DUF2384 family)